MKYEEFLKSWLSKIEKSLETVNITTRIKTFLMQTLSGSGQAGGRRALYISDKQENIVILHSQIIHVGGIKADTAQINIISSAREVT